MAIQDVTGALPFLGCYVQKVSTSLGFNSQESTLDLTLVAGDPNNSDDAAGSFTDGVIVTGFLEDQALPGTMSSLSWGSLNFAGLIQNYTESFSSAGRTYKVKMVDPRTIFDNVFISIDGRGSIPSGVTIPQNYFDLIHYYGNDIDADINEYGASFNKIYNFINDASSFIINAFGHQFSLQLTSGFIVSATGSAIPTWYRIPGSQISLSELLTKVSNDFSFDYYAHADYNSYVANPTGVTPIIFRTINRVDATGVTNEITDIITSNTTSGTMISYNRGKELKTDPSTSVVLGAPYRNWHTPLQTDSPSSTNQIYRFWGLGPFDLPLVSKHNSDGGPVLLDHIVGDYAVSGLSGETITLRGYVTSIDPTYQDYPPEVNVTVSSYITTGYIASERTLQASLHSQVSWETFLFQDHQTFAENLGILECRFRTASEYQSVKTNLENSGVFFTNINIIPLEKQTDNIINRTNKQEALIAAVYEATRNIADTFYGKAWMVKLPTSNWIRQTTFYSTDRYQETEYEIADSAWSQTFGGGGYPSSVTNHALLNDSDSSIFKDDKGRLKAFVSLKDFDTLYLTNGFPFPIDTSKLPRDELFYEYDHKLVIPIQVEQYRSYPASGILQLSTPLEAKIEGSGYDQKYAFHRFLTELGYDEVTIVSGEFMSRSEASSYGLGNIRVPFIETVPENHGIHIPIQSKLYRYGPFVSSGDRAGGLNIIIDDSLEPSTYGSNSGFNTAGNQIANNSVNTTTIVDFGDITLAGLPVYDIGEQISNSTNVTSVNTQYGPQGLTTTYTLRTYSDPIVQKSKLLQNKILKIALSLNRVSKDITNLDKIINENRQENIYKPSDLFKFSGGGSNNKKFDHTVHDVSKNISLVEPTPEKTIWFT